MKLALTYDDGPNDPYTMDLLEVLGKHGVFASFFMVGKFVLQRPDIVHAVANAGHLIGNHTLSHSKLPELSIDEAATEVRDCQLALDMTIGNHSDMFRPPFILSSPAIEEMVAACGLTTILFQAAAGDGGERHGVDFIIEKVIRELHGESGIILMHDGCHLGIGADRSDTVAATDLLITHYKDLGAEFVFPSELT